uniref:Uncharacterized protein n=1 Tax=Ditylenchus dipsaci TaxID=166011 RepID=A0A915D586_9BILA
MTVDTASQVPLIKQAAQQHHHRDYQEYVKQRLEAEAIQEDFAFMKSTDQLNFRTLKTKFMKLLEDKFYLENSRIHVLVTFLDLRFKDYYSANILQFNQKASKWLLEEVGEQEGELDAEQDLSSPAPR